MTTVRFSKALVEHIGKNARSKMQFAVGNAQKAKPGNAWGQRIYDILFGDIQPQLAQIPSEWFKHVDTIAIGRVGIHSCALRFDFATPQPWPMVLPETELVKKNYSFQEHIILKDHPVWSDFEAEVAAYSNRVEVAKQKQTEFYTMVVELCNTYSTLAPALKAWPPLWELIPEDVQNIHREVKAREKTEVVLGVDTDKLTSLVTAAKFGL